MISTPVDPSMAMIETTSGSREDSRDNSGAATAPTSGTTTGSGSRDATNVPVTRGAFGRPGSGSGQVLSHFFSAVHPIDGQALGIAFGADPFGLTFALITAAVGTLLLIYVLSELGDLGRKELGGFACLFQLLLAALIGAALTADTINLFVWFEVAALASYGLTVFFLERPIAL